MVICSHSHVNCSHWAYDPSWIKVSNRQQAGFYTRDQANNDHDGAGDVAEEGDPGGEGGVLLLPGEARGGEVVPGHGCLG